MYKTRTLTGQQSPPDPAPPPINGQGYSLVFFDDFITLDANTDGTVSDSKRWNKLWYQNNWPAGSVTCANSIVSLSNSQANSNQQVDICTRRATTPTVTGGNVTNLGPSGAWVYGYFEANFKIPSGIGTWPAFWLFSLLHSFSGTAGGPTDCLQAAPYTNGTANKLLTSELDILEGGWEQGGFGTSGIEQYNATIHRNVPELCGVVDDLQTNFRNSSLIAGSFHTHAVLWTSTDIKYYLDNVLTYSTVPYDSTPQPMFVIFSSWKHTDAVGYPGSVTDPSVLQVDWVKVWQKS